MQRTSPSSATASRAALSPPDLPEPGGLCAIHQPNFLPRLTTLAKLFAADYWIVLDDVQFTATTSTEPASPASTTWPGSGGSPSPPACPRDGPRSSGRR